MSQEDTEKGQEPNPQAEPDGGQEPQPKGETFDKAYVQGLRQEAARHRKDAQEARAKAQEYEDRDKSELEKLTGKVSKAERERDEAKATLMRYEVAAERQIPPDAVDLLTGTTREELEAKADRILQIAAKPEPTPDFDGGARDPAPEPKAPADAHNDALLALLGRTPDNQ